MRDSKTWWEETKNNPVALQDWLKDQYHGEVTAATRIGKLAISVDDEHVSNTLTVIATQEATHANWVHDLLVTRGLNPEVLVKDERYWNKTLPENYQSMPIEKLAAIGAHAEAMRLERIKVIAADEEAPSDIKEVFTNILKDEVFHERAFRKIAGDDNMKAALDAHQEGLAALGLTI